MDPLIVKDQYHDLQESWVLWAHFPEDNDWSLKSYKLLFTFKTIEDVIIILHMLPDIFVKHCMLFVMKSGIMPIWEDPKNKNGGAFSYKISNKNVVSVWRELTYALVGNTITNNNPVLQNITGITISPKNNFCVVKIWTTTCEFQNPNCIISSIRGLTNRGCLFKQHK